MSYTSYLTNTHRWFALLLTATLAPWSTVKCQISVSSLQTVYSQSFDGLPASGNFTWTDNTTVPGWYAATNVTSGFSVVAASTGSTTTGGLYSFGASGSTDRALGSIGSSSAGDMYWGVKLVNNTGWTITGFQVSFTGEQWRNSAAAAQSVTFQYSLSASALRTGTYQTVSAATFTSPVTGGTVGLLNGNAAANRVVIGPVVVNNLNWAPGKPLWIRFYDPDHPGNDHGLAIDDFSFQIAGLTLSDTDLDGLPNSWEVANQLDPYNPYDANADADHDGLTNFEEYWMGTDPRNPADPVRLIVNKPYATSVQDGTYAHPFGTIRDAINAVPDNETRAIVVLPGLYPERPYIHDKKGVFIISETGADTTIIDGQFADSSVVRFDNVQKGALVGFTVRNASTSWYGAGVRVDSASGNFLISENKITNNTTTNAAGGGGLYLNASTGSRIINNFITKNTAPKGGGVLIAGGSPDFWFNTIAGNTSTSGAGAGLNVAANLYPDVRDNIIWQNIGGTAATQMTGVTGSSGNIFDGAVAGSADLNANPQFVNAANGDYHIGFSSPARNAALPLPNSRDYELEFRPDVFDKGKDIGADEILSLANDYDGDGLPDDWEIANFGDLSQDGNGDYDGDGILNKDDARPADGAVGRGQVKIIYPQSGTVVH